MSTKTPPNSQLLDAVLDVEEHLSEEKTWNTAEFMVPFAMTFEDDTLQLINVIDHIGFNVRNRNKKGNRHAPDKRYWLPKKFNSDDTKMRDEVRKHFSVPAVACGFALRVKAYDQRFQRLRLFCPRGRYYVPSTSTVPDTSDTGRVATTRKPIKGHGKTCPFNFAVSWDKELMRWYIPEFQGGDAMHCGHIRVSPDIAPARFSDLSKEEQQIVMDCQEARVKVSSMDKFIVKRNNLSLTVGQLEYISSRTKELNMNRLISSVTDGKMQTPKTPADRLLAHFDNNDTLSYVALYAEVNTEKITIRKKCKFRQNHSIEDVPPSECNDNVNSAMTDAEKNRESILRNLTVSSEMNKILLAFAWTDDESRLRFDMYPEFIGGDCVSKLNREERQVMHWTGLDSRNMAYTFTSVFMPSEANWTFYWVVSRVMRNLHNKETLAKVQVIVTDQDGELNDVIGSNIGPGKVFPNAVHRLCAWHKLDRNLTNKSPFTGLLASDEMKSPDAKAEWNAVVTWLWTLCRLPETEDESNLLLTLLDCYLDEDNSNHRGSLSSQLKTKVRDFITKSFEDKQHKLFAHNFFDFRDFGKITSSLVEAENSAAKRHSYAPTPMDNIDTAQQKMEERTLQRHRERRRRSADGLTSLPASEEHRDATVTELTKYASDRLWEQHRLASSYSCMSESASRCLVKLTPREAEDLQENGDVYEVQQSLRKKFVVPALERTRVVTIVYDPVIKTHILKCTCGTFNSMGISCRHIMAATQLTPTKFDAQFRWWRQYDIIFLGKTISETLRNKLAKADAVSRSLDGIPTELSQLPHLTSDESEQWFRSTVGTSVVRKRGYWSTKEGRDLITLAEFQISCYAGQGMRPFGTVQEVMSSRTGPFGLEVERDTEEDLALQDVDSDDEPVLECNSQDPTVVEMLSPMEHLDKYLTEETMSDIVKKGAYRSLHPLFTKMTDCANNRRRAGILWKCLQHTHQLLLNDLRKDELRSGKLQQGTLSDPSNTSGTKRSNARTKRPQDQNRPNKKKR